MMIGATARSGSRKTGLAGALVASSALFRATWGAPALADPGARGAFKIVGASYSEELRFWSCMRRHAEPDFRFPHPSPNDGAPLKSGTAPNCLWTSRVFAATSQNYLVLQQPPREYHPTQSKANTRSTGVGGGT